LLLHQLPPKPAYLRVKVGRRLARIGAVGLKNTVYALPAGSSRIEDLQWVRREIIDGGGDATIIEAAFVDGLSDSEVEGRFRAARAAEYDEVAKDARALAKRIRGKDASDVEGELARLERRAEEIAARDFFGGDREAVDGLLSDIRRRLRPARHEKVEMMKAPRGATWVTRAGVHVDRIASAWLVKRFVDPEASFKFVSPTGYRPAEGELRFDMFEAEFSHEGDRCTFETLTRRFAIDAPGIGPIGEIVHDIDVKDGKFAREETAGVAAAIAGIALRHRNDDERLAHGFELFDTLAAWF
jgi:hypothetical protein